MHLPQIRIKNDRSTITDNEFGGTGGALQIAGIDGVKLDLA